MISVSDWARGFRVDEKPWLLLGKGPTFSRFDSSMEDDFFLIGLNHVSRSTRVTLAHFIDIEAVLDCIPEVLDTAGWVVMPWHPHDGFKPSAKTLADYAREVPELGELEEAGRLLTYNLANAKRFESFVGAPTVDVRFFSSEAALNLLAECGASVIRSLGVDGGTRYASQFSDLASNTRLANGQPTFDLQFDEIARTIRKTGVHYAPLHVDSPARVFVGADQTQELPFRVLEYSVKSHASLSVEFTQIDDQDLRVPDDPANRPRTGFSFSRFKIPRLCGYSGRAIYLDADMLVFSDLLDLWARPFDGAAMLYAQHSSEDRRRPQYSVLVLDCGVLDWDPDEVIQGLDDGRFSYESLMYDFDLVPDGMKRPALPEEWNSLERHLPGETRLLHFTDMPTQPWISQKNKYSGLWLRVLREALSEGFIDQSFLFDQIERGHVSPDLPRWLGIKAPEWIKRKRRSWVPPYRRFEDSVSRSTPQRSAWARLFGA